MKRFQDTIFTIIVIGLVLIAIGRCTRKDNIPDPGPRTPVGIQVYPVLPGSTSTETDSSRVRMPVDKLSGVLEGEYTPDPEGEPSDGFLQVIPGTQDPDLMTVVMKDGTGERRIRFQKDIILWIENCPRHITEALCREVSNESN